MLGVHLGGKDSQPLPLTSGRMGPPAGSGAKKTLDMFLFAGLLWAIWTTRNKMAIEKKFPKNSIEVLIHGISFLQKWEILLKEEDRCKVEEARTQMVSWCRSFAPSREQVSDVFEL